ncbi:MAG: prolipoprotein diacylglyceryl transferase [Chloroflexi bacterium]|nr:prolipoprotein diacylglyceryl transferase [Chloroflexota bacterium]
MYPPVNPILFHLGPLSVHWYGLTMTTAIFVGALVASNYVSRRGQDGNTIWDMLLWVLIPGIIGARLYYVFIQSPRSGLGDYLAHPIKIVEVWNGGIHIYGAFIFGGLALILYLRTHKLPFPVYFDGIGLGLIIGQAIGRIGNFINQELYGPPTTLPWGLRIDAQHRLPPYNDMLKYPDGVRFQPLFLYEMLWDALGFALLLWIERRFGKRLRDGDLFLLFLIWSPLGRFFIEFLRTDSWFFPGTPFNLVHLLTAIAVLGASIALYLRHRPKTTATNATGGSTSATPITSSAEDEQQEEMVAHDTSTTGTVGIEGQS